MKEQDILTNATKALAAISDISVEKVSYEAEGKDKGYDGALKLKYGNHLIELLFEIKGEVRSADIFLAQQYKNVRKGYLLISRYIPKPVKEVLKEAGINYLESSGNCFIRTDQVYCYINDRPVTEMRLPADGKLWKAAGLKFLFVVLCQEAILESSYRRIADAAGISLGSVGPLIKELANEGYLLERKMTGQKTWILEGREKLIQRWAAGYQNTLRPKLQLGRFKFLKQQGIAGWQRLQTNDFLWGGEPAGAELTDHLLPGTLTIYTKADKLQVMINLMLIPDPEGPVEMLTQFWQGIESDHTPPGTVPPLMAYAELWSSFDSRNQETAERIKSKYLNA